MAEKKKQTFRFSDDEMGLIKGAFLDNDELLRAIRKVFLQLSLSAVEQALIINLKDKGDLLKIIRKTFLPTIDGNAPFGQVIDLWMTLAISEKSPEVALPHIQARELLINYLDQQLSVLEGNAGGLLDFNTYTDLKDKNIYAKLIMRNTLITHVEQQLNQFMILAGMTGETVEQTKTRLLKDSNK